MISAVKLMSNYKFVRQHMHTSIPTDNCICMTIIYYSKYINISKSFKIYNSTSSCSKPFFSVFLIQVATVSSETDKPHSGVVREPPFRKQRSGHGVTLPQLPSFLGGTAEWRQTLNITWIYHPLGPCPVTVLSLRASLHEKAHTWAFCFIQASSNSMHPICHRLGWIHQSQKSPHAIRWTVKVLHQTLMPQWRGSVFLQYPQDTKATKGTLLQSMEGIHWKHHLFFRFMKSNLTHPFYRTGNESTFTALITTKEWRYGSICCQWVPKASEYTQSIAVN